jgi:glucan phosphorylase
MPAASEFLAGDTARSCADLELPLVFVTLVSRAGYLRQRIDDTGRQVMRVLAFDVKPESSLAQTLGFQYVG